MTPLDTMTIRDIKSLLSDPATINLGNCVYVRHGVVYALDEAEVKTAMEFFLRELAKLYEPN